MKTTTQKQNETKEAARVWVDAGKPCTYQYGFSYKGAEQRPISNEEATQMLSEESGWNFGIGYYELRWTEFNGQNVLCFNEYSIYDME